MKDFMPGREAFYSESGQASIALLLHAYGTAARSDDEAAYWMRIAVQESRRTGAAAIQVASGSAAVAYLLVAAQFEDAIEMGVFVGRGMVVGRARGPKKREDFDGVGMDIAAEYRQLPEDQRHLGDRFALITGVIPTAIAIVRMSVTDSTAAVANGRRVAALCRALAADSLADQELWRTALELFELSSVDRTNITQIVARIERIVGDGEREVALRILGYVLATWHASPAEAISAHLAISEALLRWHSPGEQVYRLVVMPYVEAYWRYTAEHCRFALRAPDVVFAALDSASQAPERERVYAILSAVSGGFRIRGAQEVLQRLRQVN